MVGLLEDLAAMPSQGQSAEQRNQWLPDRFAGPFALEDHCLAKQRRRTLRLLRLPWSMILMLSIGLEAFGDQSGRTLSLRLNDGRSAMTDIHLDVRGYCAGSIAKPTIGYIATRG